MNRSVVPRGCWGLLGVVGVLTMAWPVNGQLAADPGLPLARPAPVAYFVAPDGDDSGQGSFDRPWRTVGHALAQLNGPGETLYLRGGTYPEHGLAVRASGVPGAPLRIRNYGGESVVIDGGLAAFRQAGNADWELVDPARQLYRSVATFPGAGQVSGYFGPDDGGWRLVPYQSIGTLTADTEDFVDQPPYYYIGPGVYWDELDQRIYYRSQLSKYQAPAGLLVPAVADPAQTPLFLFTNGWIFDVEADVHDVTITGLVLRYQGSAIRIGTGAHDIVVKDCDVLGGRYHILVREGAHDLRFDGITVDDKLPPWIAWSDVKLPSIGRPGHLFQGAGLELSGAVDAVEVANCSFRGLFGGVGATKSPSNLRVHHNVFDVTDDVFQLGTAAWNVEFDHNLTLRGHSGGPAWSGSGAPPPGLAGTVWVHHNVIDTTIAQRFGRSDPLGLLDDKYDGPAGDGFAAGRPFGSHSPTLVTGPVPWKIYHNTCVISDDASNGGAGQAYKFDLFDLARPHEVYNNIFVQVADEWILRNARAADGSQIHDGNLYWAPNRSATTALLEDVYDVLGGTPLDILSLDWFRNSADWLASTAYYPPGWETNGVEADPELDRGYRPSATGPAASGAVDLSGKDWPGLSGETFRGALVP